MWIHTVDLPLSEIRQISPLRDTWFEARPQAAVRPKQHTLRAVDRALNALRRDVINMGWLAIDQIDWVVGALLDGQLQLSEDAQARAITLREFDRRIDQEIFKFIALHQPLATDLRLVRSLLRIRADFGDLGVEVETIAGFAPRFAVAGAQSSPLAIIRQLKRMAELSAELLQNSVQALHDSERDLARKVVEQKDEVRSQFESAGRVVSRFSF